MKLEIPAIARGRTEFILNTSYALLMKRTWNEEEIYIAMNFSSSKEQTLSLEGINAVILHDLETGEGKAIIQDGNGGKEIVLPPYAIVVMANE